MEKFPVIYNGCFFEAGVPFLDANNRAFRYGDSLFESIRIINGKPIFLEGHISRLFEGMQVLGIDRPIEYSIDYFRNFILQLIEKSSVTEGGRARISVFRNGDGYFTPNDNSPSFTVEVQPYLHNFYTLNEDGLNIDIYADIKKPVNKLSMYKTGSSLIYVMAGMYARSSKLDESLIVNDRGNIIEASNANLFIVSNGVLYTPTLADGCLAGVMRMQVINLALDYKIKVYECSLTPQNLLVADEVFVTNAIRGLQWVGSYRQKRYYNKITRDLVEKLNRSLL
jgi:branched-subunit amino acid aminotransferase/4-amino-4-deoxychorismate lyase